MNIRVDLELTFDKIKKRKDKKDKYYPLYPYKN